MRIRKHLCAVALATVLVLSTAMQVSAATTYTSKTGSVDGYSYSLSISGSTISLQGSTQYAKANCSRSSSITGTYTGASFTGTRTKTNQAGAASGAAVATVNVPNTSTDRFTSATCVHSFDGWSRTSSTSVY